ncbi:MAG: hemolysin III family protein [Propionibacteriaceae bacterium]|jgi:hemolysin III|nr:hemolysin III family protein [Propionibacteriaceae bacterium]
MTAVIEEDVVHQVERKPLLRGWLHAFTCPMVLAASIVFLCLAPSLELKGAMVVYLVTSLIMFGNSAVYHIFNWSPPVKAVLRRVDHSNIYLFIAGTYTPLSVALLAGGSRLAILLVIWIAAVAGIAVSIFWLTAPRWITAGLYVFIGWAAVWWMPEFWNVGGPAIVWLLIAGGVVYSIGAFFYAKKWPNPWPGVFGFHEMFHLCTVLAAACHFVAIGLAVMR